MSASWPKFVSVIYVMVVQAISGIAKDLSKMSAKSAIKTVVALPTPLSLAGRMPTASTSFSNGSPS